MPEIKKEQKAAAPCPLYKKCGGCQLQNLIMRNSYAGKSAG